MYKIIKRWNTHNVPAVLCEFCRLRKTAYLCRVIGEFVEGMTTLIAQAVPSPKSVSRGRTM